MAKVGLTAMLWWEGRRRPKINKNNEPVRVFGDEVRRREHETRDAETKVPVVAETDGEWRKQEGRRDFKTKSREHRQKGERWCYPH